MKETKYIYIFVPLPLTRPISSSLREVSTWCFREQIARSKKTPALQAKGSRQYMQLNLLGESTTCPNLIGMEERFDWLSQCPLLPNFSGQ